jgi:hypothetical protein
MIRMCSIAGETQGSPRLNAACWQMKDENSFYLSVEFNGAYVSGVVSKQQFEALRNVLVGTSIDNEPKV